MSRKTISVFVAAALVIGVGVVGVFGYRASVSADTITPGYATARVFMEMTVPSDTAVTVKATFTPTDANAKKFYFKSRTFEVQAGITTINWFVKKIPAGSYTVSVTSDKGDLEATSNTIALANDKVADTAKFSLNLGLPATSTPEVAPVEAITLTPTPEATGTVGTPPVPSLDSSATTEQTPSEDIPSLPTT